MTKKLLINGAAGRIGSGVTPEIVELSIKKLLTGQKKSSLELVALNDPTGIDSAVKVYTGRDPVHGIREWVVGKIDNNTLVINGQRIKFYAEKDISNILKEHNIEMILECSGFYGDPKVDKTKKLTPLDSLSRQFLQGGVETIIQTYPAKTADKTIIMGVNHESYDSKKDHVISNASCTTKSLALPLQILLDNGAEIPGLLMDTVHAATASQKLLDSLSQIVTHSTGAAKATGQVIPSLNGKMNGMAYRVPTLDGSFSNLYFNVLYDGELTSEGINKIIREHHKDKKYAGRVCIFEGEDAGTFDIIGKRENAVFIPSKTNVIPEPELIAKNGKGVYLVSIVSGYDNELGSSVDPVLLAEYIAER